MDELILAIQESGDVRAVEYDRTTCLWTIHLFSKSKSIICESDDLIEELKNL